MYDISYFVIIIGLTLCSTRSIDGGKTWSKLKPIELPETIEDCHYYGIDSKSGAMISEERRQSHDGYQLLVDERIYLFYGWNRGQQPPNGPHLSRTDMQLEEGFWMRWSDDYGETFDGGRVLIPVKNFGLIKTTFGLPIYLFVINFM